MTALLATGRRARGSLLLARWRALPRAAKGCAAVGMLNALVWALLIPPFHVPDEPVHFAYTQHLAETGKPPRPVEDLPRYSTELEEALRRTFLFGVIGSERDKPIWSDVQQEDLDETLSQDLPRDNGGGNSPATNNPVLYYALGAVPYRLAGAGDALDRLFAVRLLSVLLAGLTVLFVFLFLRELLPATPWAWTAGALAAAFQPTFGFISGGVNNDNLLFATSAILLFAMLRALRRGLDVRRGAAIGAALGLGLISKATLIAFVPAAAFTVAWLVWRAGRERPAALRGAAVALGCAALPVLLYIGLNLVAWDRPVWSGTSQYGAGLSGEQGAQSSFGDQLAYLWQSYLPRLPFMPDMFPGPFPLWETWFKGFIGRFGWLDYDYPIQVYGVALAVFAVVFALAGLELWRSRAALRRRWPELVCFLLALGGLIVVIGVAGYGAALQRQGFEQARYLLPLLALYGAVIALAARAGGRRFGPVVGVLVVALAIAHGVFGQLLTIVRYYG